MAPVNDIHYRFRFAIVLKKLCAIVLKKLLGALFLILSRALDYAASPPYTLFKFYHITWQLFWLGGIHMTGGLDFSMQL